MDALENSTCLFVELNTACSARYLNINDINLQKCMIDDIKDFSAIKDVMDAGSDKSEDDFNVFNSLVTAVSAIPVRFVLDSMVVTTTGDSTTAIPYDIIKVPVGAHYFGVSHMATYIKDLAVAGFGEVYDFTQPYIGYDESISNIKATEGEIEKFKVQQESEDGITKVWLEENAPSTSGVMTMADGDAQSSFTLRSDNKTAVMKDGVMTFTGSGSIDVVANQQAQGTLYIDDGVGDVKTYTIEVVPEHTCNCSQWETLVPATPESNGYRWKRCDICNQVLEFEEIETCSNHEFTEYEMVVQETDSQGGVYIRTCKHCGCFDYKAVDPIGEPAEMTVSEKKDQWSIEISSPYEAMQAVLILGAYDAQGKLLTTEIIDLPQTQSTLHISLDKSSIPDATLIKAFFVSDTNHPKPLGAVLEQNMIR